jgi:hypothetical protein
MELTCGQSGSILEVVQGRAQATNEFAAWYQKRVQTRSLLTRLDGLSHRSMERSQKWTLHQSQQR